MTLSYQQALDFIFDYVDYEKQARFTYDAATLDLSRMKRLLALLGEPHRRFRSVHIAGTKGKGSTAAMSEAILRAAGFRTGLYTSPHLHTFRERIRVDGQLLSREEVVTLVEQCRPAIEAVEGITTFEIITALGFLHFAQQEVEWAVLETGLGGRLDATNVVLPEITAITTLSLDHTYLLGDTLALIAGEKAGIIKPGVPLVCAPQATEAMQVVEAVCRERQAELILVGRDWNWERVTADVTGQTLDVRGQTGGQHPPVAHEKLRIPFLGQHQLLNATMAVALMATLRRRGIEIPDSAVREGLAQTRWPGRLETLQHHPLVVVDSAHNPDSVAKLAAALGEWFPHERMALVFGASEDKDTQTMLKTLLPLSDYVITTRARHPRATDPHQLAQQAASLLKAGQLLTVSKTVAGAVEQSLAWAMPRDLVCATGSIFVVGEVRETLADALPPDDWAHEAEPVLAVH